MAKVSYKTEDQVRDGAKIILGFDKTEEKVQQGTGQITTFNQLGFKGVIDKPDGWYLPDDLNAPAIILETKSEAEDISLQKWVDELEKNCNIVLTKYTQVVGILYNGTDVRVFLNNSELSDAASTLQDKTYYLSLFTKNAIDKQRIYNLTKKINDCLHIDFGIKNLYHRMIFTACALVGKRYGAILVEGMDFTLMKNSILSTLSKSLEDDRKQNLKLDILIEVYVERPNSNVNPAKVISFGAENATFFYQKSEWISGRDMYYIDTRGIDEYACLFITSCLQPIAEKYSYNYGMFPDLLKEERIKLPANKNGDPDYAFMEKYMRIVENKVYSAVKVLSAV